MADHTYNPDGIYLENRLNRNRAERYEAPQDLDLKHQQMAQVGLATDYMKQQLAENPEYDSNGNYTGEDGVWVRKADMLKAFDPNGELSKKLNAPIEQNLYEKSSGEPRGFFENIDESFRRGVERAGVPLLEVPRILGIDAEVGGVPLSDYSRIYHRYLDEREAEDPVKGDNWFSNSIHGAVGMLPEMTTGILANMLAPGSGLAYWSTQGAGDVYDEMEQAGVSRECFGRCGLRGNREFADRQTPRNRSRNSKIEILGYETDYRRNRQIRIAEPFRQLRHEIRFRGCRGHFGKAGLPLGSRESGEAGGPVGVWRRENGWRSHV